MSGDGQSPATADLANVTQCPLLTPASKAAPLGFPNVPRALVSFSLLPSCRTPLFLLGHWGSLGVPGPSWDGAWAEHTLGAHTVPAAVCVGAGYGHPTAWEPYLWDTGSQDPSDSGSPSPCLGFLQEANPRKARVSTPTPAQASRASPQPLPLPRPSPAPGPLLSSLSRWLLCPHSCSLPLPGAP